MNFWLTLGLVWFVGSQALGTSMTVYVADGLTRIRPDDPPPTDAVVAIAVARNEYEPFQIIVRAGDEELKGVTVEVSGLRGMTVSLFREHYIVVTEPSPKSKEGAGWYPDALVPLDEPFTVAPNKNQPVWADVFVPKGTKPGNYAGKVTITALNQKSVTIPIKLTVWSFTLPDTPSMRSNFGGFGGRLAKAYKLEENSPEFRALERRYAAAMAAHRICPPIPRYLHPKVKPDGSIDPSVTHAALKDWMETFHVTGFPLNLQGNDRERNIKYLRAMWAYLKENGWEKFAYIYVLDEPNDAKAYEAVRERAKLIHKAQPGIKVLCTEQPTPSDPGWGTLVGSVDIWVPLWPLFDEKAGAERLAAGEELWSYTALCQGKKGEDTPFWELDFPLLNYRIPAWMSWRSGMSGLLYWTTVYWEKAGDVWTNPLTYNQFNGEGSLFYPGADGPVASMRLKAIREGLEDYEYLKLLTDIGDKDFADHNVTGIAQSWTQWDSRPGSLFATREKIAQCLTARPSRRAISDR